ncbi:hypothetical protein HMPREF0591_4809 [Mycobacterium parascrofulaceum ATCC BAA-614]|uniref:Major tail protein n=1 Tax=Mycobacterium parascrofulaceum ATCC BAA-614 TaxID=525368 RepID=D5PF65_9MYCO|nr:hypothetical protein [Mycobacterium parascrofulaceum]EFG75246.1 hypothetical protein HMPREF0591_4809 [Mycobacterium parascrofulaceum ATCC BAA-614]
MTQTINPELTTIPDEAEVWYLPAEGVDDISTYMPTNPDADLDELGWEEVGLIDDQKGIPLDPSGDVKEYDAFGHPAFRVKFFKGKLKSGFTALEWNSITRKFVLPGSSDNKIGKPQNVQGYLLYRFVDEDTTVVWVQLRPALLELKSHGGIIQGELSFAEMTVHHTADANGDVFQRIDASSDDVTKTFTIGTGVTAYTATVGANTTPSLSTLTAAALQTALRALASVQALPTPGATVTGSGGAPGSLSVVFTASPGSVSASGTGGTVSVA